MATRNARSNGVRLMSSRFAVSSTPQKLWVVHAYYKLNLFWILPCNAPPTPALATGMPSSRARIVLPWGNQRGDCHSKEARAASGCRKSSMALQPKKAPVLARLATQAHPLLPGQALLKSGHPELRCRSPCWSFWRLEVGSG